MRNILVFAALIACAGKAFANREPFEGVSELAIVSTGGNSRVETYNAETQNQYTLKKRSYHFGGHYTLGLAEQASGENEGEMTESARNWDAKLGYEQELKKHVSAFAAVQYEGDQFSGYSQRENHDIGGKYIFVDTEKRNLWLELGYRYTEEERTEANKDGRSKFYFNKAVLTGELSRRKETFTYSLWLQYVPNFTNADDYQINFEPSFTVILNDTFSMKVGYKGNYDNEPNLENNQRLDWKYTTALVATY